MFGLSWVEIIIILGVGVFVLGPERIPVAVRWVTTTMTKVRGMAATAQSDLAREIGPELDELRRQVSDLQSMKEFQDLKSLRDINPKRYLQKNILGDQFSGGVTGFLGLNGEGTPAEQANAAAEAAAMDTGTPGVPVPAAATAPAMDLAYPTKRVTRSLAPGELAPFDSDGT
ncbi:Sec-independent protein translocase protein TatB [Nakamurella deserti]|uniref:Sec-independent protein translocase protein TatB n=1 Tax=Nakamurella deserti TaxID=2164074 RepID=UPI000DBE9CD7|nr:Sec-independent protein translocase protein TatB [Nakamurella deserti]